MDFILLFLMHTLRDLEISEEDLLNLLNCPANDPLAIEDLLVSSSARQFVRSRRDWHGEGERLFEESYAQGVRWCRFGDPDYPLEWLKLSHKPIIFSYRGRPVWRTKQLLAVVGSRTPMGDTKLWMQRELGQFLRRNDVGIVSGGARGVDNWAHRMALDCGRPTVCVLPSGVLKPYPPGSENFLESIVAEGGAVLSTFHPHELMRKSHFHVRNRWIAGLSPLCFVVEANRRSGSALTAKLASDESRALCTVPVFPHAEQGLANLDLLMSGAAMIRDHWDLTTVWNLHSRPNCV